MLLSLLKDFTLSLLKDFTERSSSRVVARGGGVTKRPERRRSSAAANAQRLGRHLRIQDQVLQVLLSAEARALHAVCAQSLGGLVLTSQLAIHFEQAGLAWDAAKTHARALVPAAACRARLR